jgi:cell division protein FtsW
MITKNKKVLAHKPDYQLAIVVFVLIILGLVLISSASVVVSYTLFGISTYYLRRQLVAAFIGLVVWIICQNISYHFWKKLAFPALAITILLLIAVFIPGLGFAYGGAQRWIDFRLFSLQPAEICKLTFILYLALWLEKKGEGIKSFAYGFLPFIVISLFIAGLIIAQPDMGTMFIIIMIGALMFFTAGARIIHVVLGFGGGFFLLWSLIKIAPYRLARITTWLNPYSDTRGISYHINQALLAIGSGGLLGLGFGLSRQKYNYLPEVVGDSIFAIIAEELGFLRSIFIIILFLFLAYRGFKIAQKAPDVFGRLVATGITSWFAFQAIINIGAMLSLLPLTGLPLPFISYGGSALVISLAAVGILMNISKQTVRE